MTPHYWDILMSMLMSMLVTIIPLLIKTESMPLLVTMTPLPIKTEFVPPKIQGCSPQCMHGYQRPRLEQFLRPY